MSACFPPAGHRIYWKDLLRDQKVLFRLDLFSVPKRPADTITESGTRPRNLYGNYTGRDRYNPASMLMIRLPQYQGKTMERFAEVNETDRKNCLVCQYQSGQTNRDRYNPASMLMIRLPQYQGKTMERFAEVNETDRKNCLVCQYQSGQTNIIYLPGQPGDVLFIRSESCQKG